MSSKVTSREEMDELVSAMKNNTDIASYIVDLDNVRDRCYARLYDAYVKLNGKEPTSQEFHSIISEICRRFPEELMTELSAVSLATRNFHLVYGGVKLNTW